MTAVATNTMFIALNLLAQAAYDMFATADAVVAAVAEVVFDNLRLLTVWLTMFAKAGAVVAALAFVAANPTVLVAVGLTVFFAVVSKKVGKF